MPGRPAGAAGRRLLQAAALIAAITAVARVAGFGRTVVFGRSVGGGCVGAVYQTANAIPNIIFDIVAGGTLAALVVPLLAPAFVGRRQHVAAQLLSALLTWTLLVMTVVAAAIAALAGVLTQALIGTEQCAGAHALATRMLLVFAPQVIFYGLGIVLAGALQAAERFSWPALAPLLSSGTVITAYLVYGALAGPGRSAADLTTGAELVLSLGTTLGVVVLAGCLVPAARRLGLRVRPTLRFPPGTAGPARRAAIAGGATLGAQQAATGLVIWLANDDTTTGTVVVVTLAQTVFLLPWAVLAVPVATSAFPRLSGLWDAKDRSAFSALTDRTSRVVIAAAALGTAAFAAAADPIATVLLDPGYHARARGICADDRRVHGGFAGLVTCGAAVPSVVCGASGWHGGAGPGRRVGGRRARRPAVRLAGAELVARCGARARQYSRRDGSRTAAHRAGPAPRGASRGRSDARAHGPRGRRGRGRGCGRLECGPARPRVWSSGGHRAGAWPRARSGWPSRPASLP